MTTPRLVSVQPVTEKGDRPSMELLKLIAEMARIIDEQAATIADHETRITALGG